MSPWRDPRAPRARCGRFVVAAPVEQAPPSILWPLPALAAHSTATPKEKAVMEKDRTVVAALTIIVTFVLLAACKIGQPVIEPAVFAVFIIVIAWPMQKALEPALGKGVALSLTVLFTCSIVLALVALIVWSGGAVAYWVRQNLDRVQDSLFASTSWLEEHDISIFTLLSERFDSAALVEILRTVAVRANTVLAFALIVLVYVILGLAEADSFRSRIASLGNRETSERLLSGGRKISEKFRAYVFVRTIASIATGLAVWILTRQMGVELAAAWGVLAFALNYLPYIGSFFIVTLPPAFAFVQMGSWGAPLTVLLGLIAINFVIGSLLEPTFSGATLSISPPVVLFAIILWTFIWGALGAFLGVPLAIAALTLSEEFPSTRWVSELLSGGRLKSPRPV
jgi:AI-2 transport protein TqsA